MPIHCYAQHDSLKKLYPFSTLETPSIMELDDNWRTIDQKPFDLPFYDEQIDELTIESTFILDCKPSDSIYLYLEGASWQVEIELNNHYLGAYLRPFATIAVPIHDSWLDESGNLLKLHFSKERQLSYHPPPFISMLKTPRLIDKEQLLNLRKEIIQTESSADTVALFAPYYQNHAYYFDLEDAYRMLRHLKVHNIRHIYFVFAPSSELKALSAQMGFKQVEKITPDTYTFFLNEYPYDVWKMPTSPHFWLNQLSGRTAHYETYYNLNQDKTNHTSFKAVLVWLILLPLLGFLLIKLLNPGFFYSMPSIFVSPKLFIDNFSDASYSNLTLIVILQLIKVLSLGAAVSMMIYYIGQAHQWQMLNIFRDKNLLEVIYRETDTLFGMFIKTSLLLTSWLIIRSVLNAILGNIYKVKGMALGILNLDLVGSYPLILFLSLPIALLIFADTQWNIFFVTGLLLVTGIYIMRKLYVFYIGLSRLFSFSPGVKILYICALNIIPYMILF